MKIVKTLIPIKFNPRIGQVEEAIVYGAFRGIYEIDETTIHVNYEYGRYSESELTPYLVDDEKIYGAAYIQGMYDMIKAEKVIDANVDYQGSKWETNYLYLKLSMFQTFKALNPTLLLTDFEIIDYEAITEQ